MQDRCICNLPRLHLKWPLPHRLLTVTDECWDDRKYCTNVLIKPYGAHQQFSPSSPPTVVCPDTILPRQKCLENMYTFPGAHSRIPQQQSHVSFVSHLTQAAGDAIQAIATRLRRVPKFTKHVTHEGRGVWERDRTFPKLAPVTHIPACLSTGQQ